MKKKIKKDRLENFNLPLEDYNFLYDYNDYYFENHFPYMWKNVALYVENNYWKKIEDEYLEFKKEILIRVNSQDCPDSKLFDSLTNFIKHDVKFKKSSIARKIMRAKLSEFKIKNEDHYYIVTKEELKELKKKEILKINERFIVRIEKNELYIEINKRTWKTIFRYWNSIDYIINTETYQSYKRVLNPREVEIINICVKEWVFYKYIWNVFGWNEKMTARILRQLWITSVFLSPQKDFKNFPKVKALDNSWYFVIEKENDLYYKNQLKLWWKW